MLRTVSLNFMWETHGDFCAQMNTESCRINLIMRKKTKGVFFKVFIVFFYYNPRKYMLVLMMYNKFAAGLARANSDKQT